MVRVNINPGVGVYEMFPSFDYKPWLAISELLDNSITSYQQNRKALEDLHGPEFRLILKVSFDRDRNELVIADNAAGIPLDRFAEAFALAKPPPDQRFISRYGVGMKAAACWFARKWTLRTSSLEESVERTVEWSTAEITKNATSDLPVVERTVGADDHYTVITLHELLHSVSAPKTARKIESFLPNIFRNFISQYGVEIYWNGQLLGTETPEVLVSSPQWEPDAPPRTWREEVRLEMPDGRTITGQVFLLRKFKRSFTALNMFWHQRLILGNIEPNHRPSDLYGAGNSFETGRLCVELNLDEYEPTIDKKGFKFLDGESSLDEIVEALKRAVPDLLRQAREYREPKIDPSDSPIPDIQPIIDKPGGDVVATPSPPTPSDPYPPSPPLPTKPDATDPIPSPTPGDVLPRPEGPQVLAQVVIPVDGEELHVLVRLDTGPGANKFVELRESMPDDTGRPWRLYIDIGTLHPFFLYSWSEDPKSRELIMVMASAIGFGEIAARRAGALMPSFVRSNVDKFLRLAAIRPSRDE